MTAEILPSRESASARASRLIAREARDAIALRGRFLFAVSGGSSPLRMLELLASEDLQWEKASLFQVDERMAPEGDEARNLTKLRRHFLDLQGPGGCRAFPVPVLDADPAAAAERYARIIERECGDPPFLDLVQLGLGADGHTASLVPGDPALRANDRPVASVLPYSGYERVTLTYPVLARARRILWVVTGSEKSEALGRLIRGDTSIPAGSVARDRATVVADRAAWGIREAGRPETREGPR